MDSIEIRTNLMNRNIMSIFKDKVVALPMLKSDMGARGGGRSDERRSD